ncbi:ATP-dependent DNA helicase RecG [compost metagenome]
MVRTNDGFEISEVDLRLRGPGDLEGTQQSGVLDLKIADLAKDQQILIEARQCVERILDEDPSLSMEKNKLLRIYFDKKSKREITWDKIS